MNKYTLYEEGGIITIQKADYIEDGGYLEIIDGNITLIEIPPFGGEPQKINEFKNLHFALKELDAQIENVLFGQSDTEKMEVIRKIKTVSENVNNIVKISGKKVYDPIVKGENIFYNLQKCPEMWREKLGDERIYYYPIQYANIEFNPQQLTA